jgi:hypothetical protein
MADMTYDENPGTGVFRIDESCVVEQISVGSYISTIGLLSIGVPVKDVAGLGDYGGVRGKTVNEVLQGLKCGGNATPGYAGLDQMGADWTLSDDSIRIIENSLGSVVASLNQANAKDQRVVCVVGLFTNSSLAVDPANNSTYSFAVAFVNGNGETAEHAMSFTIGPSRETHVTLDGKQIY